MRSWFPPRDILVVPPITRSSRPGFSHQPHPCFHTNRNLTTSMGAGTVAAAPRTDPSRGGAVSRRDRYRELAIGREAGGSGSALPLPPQLGFAELGILVVEVGYIRLRW